MCDSSGVSFGPLLWNLTYGKVLRAVLSYASAVICYADDIGVGAWRGLWEAVANANMVVAYVVREIRGLILKIAGHKSEAVFFRDPSVKPSPDSRIMVNDTPVQVGRYIKG